MNKVKIKRPELLEAIRKNRDNHTELFRKGQEGYRKAVILALEQRLKDAREGRKIVRGMPLPEPENHTADYDRVIRMLEMSVEEIIEISEPEFNMYVMDNWAWKPLAMAKFSNYTRTE